MSMFALRGGKGKRAEPNYIIMVHARIQCAHTRNNARRHYTPKPYYSKWLTKI